MPPVITVGPTYTVTDSTIVAVWTTDINSDSNLSAGGKAAIDNGFQTNVTSHQCIVTGLLPNTVYSCQVASGGTSSSPQNVTTGASVTRLPIMEVKISNAHSSTVNKGDTFYSAWSNDGNVYSTQDDGQGIAAGASNAGFNMQIVRITIEDLLVGVDTNHLSAYGGLASTNGTDGPAGAPMSYKLSGLFPMNGSLFGFETRTPFGQPQTQWYGNIIRSDDHGTTWNNHQNTASFNANGSPDGPGVGMWSDSTIGWIVPVKYAGDDGTMGYNTAGNGIDGANGFVYLVFTDGYWNDGSALYLMRVPRVYLSTQTTTNFQYWNGPASPTPADFVNDANWTNTSSSKRAIYSVANQVSAPDIAFIPAMNRYLMLEWYQVGGSTSNTNWVILEAPTPAGPWTQVATQNNNPSGFYNPCFNHYRVASNTSTDQLAVPIYFSGDYNNQPTWYHPFWATIYIRTAAGAGLPWVRDYAVGGGASTSTSIVSENFASVTGDLLVAAVRIGSNLFAHITSVKNAATVSFTQVPGSTYSQSDQAGALYYLPNTTGNSSDAVTVALSFSEVYRSLAVFCIGGCSVSPFDQFAATTTRSGGTYTSGSFTTTKTREIIAASLITDAVNAAYTPGSGYSLDRGRTGKNGETGYPLASGEQFSAAQFKIVNAIQAGVTAAMTTNQTPTNGVLLVATFKSFPTISGNAGVAGATVSYSGTASGSVTSASDGSYVITGLADGPYTVTPSKTGYTFNPASANKTISGADQTQDFTASSGVIMVSPFVIGP